MNKNKQLGHGEEASDLNRGEQKSTKTTASQGKPSQQPEPTGATMSLFRHLSELRKRLIICLLFFLAATFLCLARAQWFVHLLISRGQQFQFVYIAPAELMLSYVQVSFIGGIVITLPIIIFHIWQFVRPGLRAKEKLGFGVLTTFGLGLFALGAIFAFDIVLPILLDFFAGLDTGQKVTAMVSIQEYISYVTGTIVMFGLVFECPIVLVALVGLDLVQPKTLQKNFKYVVLCVAIVAAIITPPDVTSQILVGVPFLVLLELSILFCQVLFHKKLKRQETQETV